MLASLPWYDLIEVADYTDAFWRRLAEALRSAGFSDVPEKLSRKIHFEKQWMSGELLFSQACGYDVLLPYASRLRLVATPRYTAPGCNGNRYASFIVIRSDDPFEKLEDLRGMRCVINSSTSHSGMNILRAVIAPFHCNGRFFSSVRVTGAHESSHTMVRSRKADVAAIDCVTYALLNRYRPQTLAGTRVLCRTRQVPAPPFVTSAARSDAEVDRLRNALFETIEDPALAQARDALLIDSAEVLPLRAYEPIVEMEIKVLELGYNEIP